MERGWEAASILTTNHTVIAVGTIALLLATKLWAGPATEPSQVSASIPTDLLLSLIDSESTAADPAVTQIGPVASGSPDEGTCGNAWAEDTFDRFFTIKATGEPGTFRIFERFKNGSFITNEGFSPGACDPTDGTPPGFVHAGIPGKMHGYLITDVTCDPSLPECPVAGVTCDLSACQTTNAFIQAFFGKEATRKDVAFFFHYSGFDGANRELVSNEWKNASTNRGGNHGDIASCFIGQLNCQ
jgi:hypothetical protein